MRALLNYGVFLSPSPFLVAAQERVRSQEREQLLKPVQQQPDQEPPSQDQEQKKAKAKTSGRTTRKPKRKKAADPDPDKATAEAEAS